MNKINLLSDSTYADIVYEVDNINLVILLENLVNLFENKNYIDNKNKTEIMIEKYYDIIDLGTLYVIKSFSNIRSKNVRYGPFMVFFVKDKLMSEYIKNKDTFLTQI